MKMLITKPTSNYSLHGKNIVHLVQGNDKLHFFYDASNKPAIVEFNGTKYAYVQDLQGDICQIVDSNGTVVVEYTYDAWGKVLNVTGSMAGTLGKIQPFRYRGYVYDVETGLYYLRSRYYNPEIGRFISAEKNINKNVYAYCYCSPTSNLDLTGNDTVDVYDRDRTLQYGFQFYNAQDDSYPPRSWKANCVRFASQCLYEGLDDPDKYYDQWHCYKKGDKSTVDQTRSWRLTNPFFSFLIDSGLGAICSKINSYSRIEESVARSKIQEGDYLFFTSHKGSEDDFFHVAVVSSVMYDDILYMANTDDCFDKSLFNCLLKHPEYEVVVVSIRD